MKSERREFSPEYEDEAVKLVVDTGRSVARVARELGLKEQTLGRWVNLFKLHAIWERGSTNPALKRVLQFVSTPQ